MAKINDVEIDKIKAFGEQLKIDPTKARKTQVIEGEWLIKEGGPQFKSKINFEGGQITFEADNPTLGFYTEKSRQTHADHGNT
jgi:hypothetical protein